jgi:hypothetical protein
MIEKSINYQKTKYALYFIGVYWAVILLLGGIVALLYNGRGNEAVGLMALMLFPVLLFGVLSALIRGIKLLIDNSDTGARKLGVVALLVVGLNICAPFALAYIAWLIQEA